MTEQRKPRNVLQTILYILPFFFFVCFCFGLSRLYRPVTLGEGFTGTEVAVDAPYILWGSIISYNVSLYCLFHCVQK